MPDRELPVFVHAEELRRRLLLCCAAVIIAAFPAFFLLTRDAVLRKLAGPVGNLVFLSPQEALVTYFNLAVYGGVVLAAPFIIYQFWAYVGLALKPGEKKLVLLYGFISIICFISGLIFGYVIILPLAIDFLLGFATDILRPMITFGNYISFAGGLALAFGIVFEMPVIIVFLSQAGFVTPESLRRHRKAVILGIFIAAAILTPPDVITQILMALPLLVLYEGSILLAVLLGKPASTAVSDKGKLP